MRILVTSTDGKIAYVKENVIKVDYVGKKLFVLYREGDEIHSVHYSSDEVMITVTL